MTAGYLFVLTQIACSVAFGHVMKWAQHRKCRLAAVGAVNYAVACALCLVWALVGGSAGLSPAGVAAGLLGGTAFVVTFFIYNQAILLTGISVASSVLRLGIVPAVVASVLVWSEALAAHQAIGIGLIVAALPLLGYRSGGRAKGDGRAAGAILLLLFLTTAAGPLAAKLAAEDNRPESRPLLLALWFGIATIISLGPLVARRLKPTRADIPLGVLLGAINVGGNFALIAALEVLPGAVVLPATSAGGLVCVVVTGALIWKERLSRHALVGAALAIPALVLVNLGR